MHRIQSCCLSLLLFLTISCVDSSEQTAAWSEDALAPGSDESEELSFFVDGRKVVMQPTDRVFAIETAEEAQLMDLQMRSEKIAGLEVEKSLFAQEGLIILRADPAFRSLPSLTSQLALAPGDLQSAYVVDGILEILRNEFLLQADLGHNKQQLFDELAERGFVVSSESKTIPGLYSITAPAMSAIEAFESVKNLPEQIDGIEFVEPSLLSLSPLSMPGSPGSGAQPSSATMPNQDDATESSLPNDPYFSSQWQLMERGAHGISVESAWARTRGNENVVVALLDEGIDLTHPDLSAKIVNPIDATGSHGIQSSPIEPHGTACAGIISASTNNEAGIAGISWESMIMPVRIASRMDPNSGWIVERRVIAEGMRAAVENGANVILGSWHTSASQTVINQIDYAIGRNVTLVFAAGNDGGAVPFPASLAIGRDVIAVGASDSAGKRVTGDSGLGWASNHGDAVTVLAPGVRILTTDNRGVSGLVDTDYVGNFWGTSASAPHVAGAAALILSARPGATPKEIKEWILDSSRTYDGTAAEAGLLDVSAAVRLAVEASTSSAQR